MSGSSVAELDHSAFEMNIYTSSSPIPINPNPLKSEDSGKKVMTAESPRIPKAGTFFSGVTRLADRIITSVKQAKENIAQAISRLVYWKDCKESMLSLHLAAATRNPVFVKDQLMNFLELTQRRDALLKLQDKSVMDVMEKGFFSDLNDFITANKEILAVQKDMMERHYISSRIGREKREFQNAHKVLEILLNKSNRRGASEKVDEAEVTAEKN